METTRELDLKIILMEELAKVDSPLIYTKELYPNYYKVKNSNSYSNISGFYFRLKKEYTNKEISIVLDELLHEGFVEIHIVNIGKALDIIYIPTDLLKILES